MTAAQFAKVAKVSKGTVLHWIRKGELPARKIDTKHGPGYEVDMEVWQAQEWLEDFDKLPVGVIVASRILPEDVLAFAKLLYAEGINLRPLEEDGRTAAVEFEYTIRARAAIHAANLFMETVKRFEEDEI